MTITETARDKITTRTKNRLALEFDRSVHTVEKWINDNDENSYLTTGEAVKIISEETGLTEDEILESKKLAS